MEPTNSCLLGAPLLPSNALDNALEARYDDLDRAISRLKLLSAHDTLLLRAFFSAPKIMHILRCSSGSDHTRLLQFYLSLRRGLSVIINTDLTDIQWIQVSLPVRAVGLGFAVLLRLHLPPFWLLLLAHATSNLSSYSTVIPHQILMSTRPSCYGPHLIRYHCLTAPVPKKQHAWDTPVIVADKASLWSSLTDSHNKARVPDYWPSLRHTAATGCMPSPWLHVERDSTTRQFGLQSGCAWKSTCVTLICVPVAYWCMPIAHTVYPARQCRQINSPPSDQ